MTTTSGTHGALDPAAVCAAAGLEGAAAAVLRQVSPTTGAGVRTAVDALVTRELLGDAARLLAHALPPRESVWWAWWCARRALSPDAPDSAAATRALAAAEQWIAQPTDQHRRAALSAAEIVGSGTPAGCAGLAAFLCGGSIAPVGAPDTAAPPFLAAKVVTGGVMLAAAAAPAKSADQYRLFITQGLEVGRRIGLWASA
jgi:hypothetical protein